AAQVLSEALHLVEPHADLLRVQVHADAAHGEYLEGGHGPSPWAFHGCPRGNAVCLRFYARVSDRSRVCLDIFTYASTNSGLIWSIMGSLPTSACPLRERAVCEPSRHAHPGGPQQPGPPLLPGRPASGKHDRVRRAAD